MEKKLYQHLGALSMLWLFFLLLSFNASAQDLTDAQRLERCQNNKNRLAELETQLRVIDAELSKTWSKKEIEDARENMVFVRSFGQKSRPEDVKKIDRIAAIYNFVVDGKGSSYLVQLENEIGKKIDKAVSLQNKRPELLNKKNEIDKQIASHRNNIIALGCDKASFNGNTPNLAGTWKGLNWVYEITQNGTAFSWKITNDAAYNESAKGDILDGNKIKATWTNKNGTDTGTGNIITDSNGKAIEIQWLNGVVFTRK